MLEIQPVRRCPANPLRNRDRELEIRRRTGFVTKAAAAIAYGTAAVLVVAGLIAGRLRPVLALMGDFAKTAGQWLRSLVPFG